MFCVCVFVLLLHAELFFILSLVGVHRWGKECKSTCFTGSLADRNLLFLFYLLIYL